MKAAVLYEFGKPLVIEEINIDPPKKEEVKVRLAATAVCHSDIHVLKGELGGETPLVAGHESAGYIAEVGEGVTSVKVGDPVVLSLIDHCSSPGRRRSRPGSRGLRFTKPWRASAAADATKNSTPCRASTEIPCQF